jgi:hypothetical protein
LRDTFGLLGKASISNVSLLLVIEWPNGTRLPVRVAPTGTGEDLMKLLHFSGFRYSPFLLVIAGNYINPKSN